jgi:hypothetical protein
MAKEIVKEQTKPKAVAHTMNIEGIMAYPYTKEGDADGFIRRRLIGQIVFEGKILQINGFATQRKGQ